MKKSISFLALGFVMLLSCKKEMNSGPLNQETGSFTIPSATPVTGRVTGIIVDEQNTPVQGATVQLGTVTVTTDAKGYFYFSTTSLDKYITTVTVTKTGYFKALRSFSATASRNYVSIKLIPKTLAGIINAAQGGIISLSNGTTIDFPAGGMIVKATGAAYQGTVNVYASYINPTSNDFGAIMPGSMMAKDNAHLFLLQSTGMIAVETESSDAQPLQLSSGKTATVHLSIPAALTANAPASINTWSLTDAGIWQKEGTAVKNGNFYDLQASHFSFWNTDIQVDVVFLSVLVKDQAGNPLPDLLVRMHVPNNNEWWATTYGITDSTGTAAGLVPAGLAIEMSATPNLYYCTSPLSTQNVGPFTSDTTLNLTVTLSSIQQLTITGTVTNCNNQPLASGYAVINAGPFNQYNVPVANGMYNLTTAYCPGSGPVNVTVYDGGAFANSADVQVAGNSVTIPALQVCGLNQVSIYEAQGLIQFGSCIAGQSLNGSNYLEAIVFVHSVGTYSISLQSNGMTFTDNGYFPRIGKDTVYLLGSGIPQATGYTLVTFYGNTGPGTGLDLVVYAGTTNAAAYTLGGPGYCSNEFIDGLYITGTALDLSNIVTMLVNVTSPGLYSISTDSVNGIRFTASGVFPATGYQRVVMNGHGMPQSTGNVAYQVTGGGNICNLNVMNFSPGTMATYDIGPGLCGNFVAHGQYTHNVPLTDQEYITFEVNVTTPGAYYISADNYNDVHFSATGIFTSTGIQSVQLAGSGLSNGAGNTGFPIFMLGQAGPYGDGSGCDFSILFN